jgi:hypothetical protein
MYALLPTPVNSVVPLQSYTFWQNANTSSKFNRRQGHSVQHRDGIGDVGFRGHGFGFEFRNLGFRVVGLVDWGYAFRVKG